MTQHVRTRQGQERFAFDDRRRLGTTRRATQSWSRQQEFPTQTWRYTAHLQTRKLVIKSKRRVTGC